MKLKFIIDKKYDKKQAEPMGFPKDKLKAYFDNQYKVCLKYLRATQKLYQKSWDEINDEFFKYIEKVTGYKWFYPKYECVISVVHLGISNWGNEPKIVRHWKENPYFMRRITAHELVLSHYFEIIKRRYTKDKLTDGQIWALAEIAAWALTSLTPEVKKWWPWNIEYYTDHNYIHVVKIQLKLKEIFLKRKDFDEYIRKGINLIKKYPRMGPHGKQKNPGNIFMRGVKK